jgi:hypothetical protein
MRKTDLLWLAFAVSVWMFILLNGYEAVYHLTHTQFSSPPYPNRYALGASILPIMLFGFELYMWFRFFRHPREPAKIFSGLIGGYIFLFVIVIHLLSTGSYEYSSNESLILAYLYIGGAHLSFAFFGEETPA